MSSFFLRMSTQSRVWTIHHAGYQRRPLRLSRGAGENGAYPIGRICAKQLQSGSCVPTALAAKTRGATDTESWNRSKRNKLRYGMQYQKVVKRNWLRLRSCFQASQGSSGGKSIHHIAKSAGTDSLEEKYIGKHGDNRGPETQ